MAWRRLRRNLAAMAGGVVLILFALCAIFADLIAPEGINTKPTLESVLENRLRPPWSSGTRVGENGEVEPAFFPFGTDDIGRDVFSRVVHGSRISLRVGFVAVLLAGAGGTILGMAAGYFGGRIDMVISRLLDVLLAFPGLLLAIVIVASLGPSLTNAMIALGVAGVPFYARVVRGSTLSAKEFGYVRAARAIGMRDTRIIVRHILPNILSPILIMSTLGLGSTIISAAGLSFLGLGASPPTPEWGLEIAQYRAVLALAPVDLHLQRAGAGLDGAVVQHAGRRPARGAGPASERLGAIAPSVAATGSRLNEIPADWYSHALGFGEQEF